MAKTDDGRFDLAQIFGSAKLEGKTTGEIWTGFPHPKYVDSFLFSNYEKTEEYKRLLETLKNNIIEYRKLVKNKKELSSNRELRKFKLASIQRIVASLSNYSRFQFSPDLFLSILVKTYEDFLSSNPQELERVPRADMEEIREDVNSKDPIIKLSTLSDNTNRSIVELVLTKEQAKKYSNSGNMQRLRKFVAEFKGVKKVSDDDIEDSLDFLCMILNADDCIAIVDNEKIGTAIYQTILYNYLYTLLDEDKQNPKEKRKYPELSIDSIRVLTPVKIRDLVSGKYSYNDNDISIHSKLQVEYILNHIEYLNIDKLFLVLALRNIAYLELRGVSLTNSQDLENVNDGDVVGLDDNMKMVIQSEQMLLRDFREEKRILELLLKSCHLSDEDKVIIYYGEDARTYSLQDVKNAMKNFYGDLYFNSRTPDFVKEQLYSGDNYEYLDYDELIKRIDWDSNDISILCSTKPNVLKRFLELGIIDRDYIQTLINKVNRRRNFKCPRGFKTKRLESILY